MPKQYIASLQFRKSDCIDRLDKVTDELCIASLHNHIMVSKKVGSMDTWWCKLMLIHMRILANENKMNQ